MFAIFVHHSVSWVERVRAAFRFALHLGHISVVIGCETATIHSFLMSLLGSCASDIVNFHWITSGSSGHDVRLGPALLDIINLHRITDEFRGSGWPHLDLRNIVTGIQRVISLSLRLELNDLWLSSIQILRLQVCLLLDETDMKGTRSRPVNIPVRVSELLFVDLLRAMKLGNRT